MIFNLMNETWNDKQIIIPPDKDIWNEIWRKGIMILGKNFGFEKEIPTAFDRLKINE